MGFWRKDQPGEPPVVVQVEPAEPEKYTGPRAWVCQDEFQPNADGTFTKVWEAGWHYSTRQVRVKHRLEVQAEGEQPEVREWEEVTDVPDRKLHLNDTHTNEREWYYEFAQPEHKSWFEKHGAGDKVPLQRLPEGESHRPDAYDTHEFHADWQRAITAQNPKVK